jgi:hypothetical protein
LDDPAFEARLMRLFSENDSAADARAFALAVESKLARSWALRGSLIAAAGVCGGAIALFQAMASGVVTGVGGVTRLAKAASEGLAALPAVPRIPVLDNLAITPEALWLVLGLAILAGALLAGRSLEDL